MQAAHNMHATHNALSEKALAASVDLLNKHLAAAIDLHGQVKQAHWNVRGRNFIAFHELFDRVADVIEDDSDQLADRARALGGAARGTIQFAAANSFLVPYSLDIADEASHAFEVAGALAAFGRSAREAIGLATALNDATTADLFTDISRSVDQQLWLVESHVMPKTHETGGIRVVGAAASPSERM